MFLRALLLVAVALAFTLPQAAADHHMAKAIKTNQTENGKVLTNAKGMTLYVFDNDKPGVSNCVGKCAENWPPMPATADSKDDNDFTVVMRADGGFQWAYKGMPLYTWIKDKKAGDVTGDGVKGVWHAARP